MQFSHFLKIFPWEENSDQLLLFSTRQTSKILIPKETYLAVENGGISPSDKALLSELGMVVPDRQAEKQAAQSLLEELNAKNSVLTVTVVLNLDCNFACIYCYEGDMKGRLYMSTQTGARLVDFIKERLGPDKTSLIVDFYGGEPLLSIGLIKSISRQLKSFTESRGAAYNFCLITNGALLKRKTAAELAEL